MSRDYLELVSQAWNLKRPLTSAMALNLIALLALPCLCLAEGNDRASEATMIFNTYCLNMPLDFAALGRRATEAHYEVFLDRNIPMPNGQVMKQKNWLIPTKSGTSTMLASSDVTNGSLHVFGCGVYVPDLDGSTLESALSALPKLGLPTKHSQLANGSTVTWWTAHIDERVSSEDSQVMLARDVPGIPGVSANLIIKTHLDH
jgi:hypothetical protein